MARITRRVAAAALAGVLFLAGGGVARAEFVATGFDVETFKPTLDPFGYGAVNGAKSLDLWQLHTQTWVNWAKNCLQFQVPRNGPFPANGRDIVRGLDVADVGGAVGLLPLGSLGKMGGLQFGLNLPVVLEEDGARIDNRLGRFHDQGLGQLRSDLKLTVVDREQAAEEDFPCGIAFRAFGEWHTGRERDLLTENGKASFGFTMILERRFGDWRFSAEGGWQYVNGTIHLAGTTEGDKMLLSAAIGYRLTEFIFFNDPRWELYGEITQQARAGNPYKKETEAPTEGDVGIKYTSFFYFVFGTGGGMNNGVGSPDGRLFGAIGVTF